MTKQLQPAEVAKIRAAAEKAKEPFVRGEPEPECLALFDSDDLPDTLIAMCDALIEELGDLLREALPQIECTDGRQSGLISEIGEYLEALKKGSE